MGITVLKLPTTTSLPFVFRNQPRSSPLAFHLFASNTVLQPGSAVFFSLGENRRKLGYSDSPPPKSAAQSIHGSHAFTLHCLTSTVACFSPLLLAEGPAPRLHSCPAFPPSENPTTALIPTPCHRVIIVLARLHICLLSHNLHFSA